MSRAMLAPEVAAPHHDLDCIVVGAGAAGLAAGKILHDAGVNFVVVEGGSEIGGRARSTTLSDGTVFERGAMVLHGLRVATWEPVIEHGLTTHGGYQHEWFTGHSVTDNAWSFDTAAENYDPGLDEICAVLLDPVNDGRSLYDVIEEFVEDAVELDLMVRLFAELVPLDPREVDATSAGQILLRDSPSTATFQLAEGYSELWRRLSAPFASRIRLDSRVTRIRHGVGGVEVSVGGTTLTAATVIVTVSVGVLQSGDITFDPPLPAEKVAAVEGLRMAPMIKVGAHFRSAVWEPATGDGMSFVVPSAKHVDFWYLPYAQRGGAPVLLALLGAGHEGLSGDADAAKAAIRADLDIAFGAEVVDAELVEILVEDWVSEPLARGAVSAVPVGMRHLRAVLAAPTAPVFWAGEACATDGHAECVEGAISTGRTAAIEALHDLRAFKIGRPASRLDWNQVHE